MPKNKTKQKIKVNLTANHRHNQTTRTTGRQQQQQTTIRRKTEPKTTTDFGEIDAEHVIAGQRHREVGAAGGAATATTTAPKLSDRNTPLFQQRLGRADRTTGRTSRGFDEGIAKAPRPHRDWRARGPLSVSVGRRRTASAPETGERKAKAPADCRSAWRGEAREAAEARDRGCGSAFWRPSSGGLGLLTSTGRSDIGDIKGTI